MITLLNERKLSEVKAEAERRELEKGVIQMLLGTVTQMGETIEALEQRLAALEKKGGVKR